MLTIIKERTRETVTEYSIEFRYKDDPNVGFGFPATSDGTIDLDVMSEAAEPNYEKCLTDVRLSGPNFTTRTYSYVDPAVGKCTCEREVVLDEQHNYLGAVKCDCGRWYNLFGQELVDPKYWEEDYDY